MGASPRHEGAVIAMLQRLVPETRIVVAIVFHSGFGHTARQAEAVRRGAESVSGASVLYLT